MLTENGHGYTIVTPYETLSNRKVNPTKSQRPDWDRNGKKIFK